jgi:uncharacterized protein YbjT (DUF2867 family)
MTVLVTGATGHVGRHVVAILRASGVPVRAFVRAPSAAAVPEGVEPAVGDFGDAASIARALAGVDRVFLASADGPSKVEHEAAVIDACAAGGVELIVKASTVLADPRSPLPALAWNGRIEEHLRDSAVPAVVLTSCFYMTNLLMAAEPVRREGTLPAPAGDGRVAMIDPRDVAAVAAVALRTDGHAGRSYHLTGPEAVTYASVAEELSRAAGTPVAFADVPEEAARQGLLASGAPGWLADQVVGVFRLIRAGALAQTIDTVRARTGREPRSVAAFARDHAAAFGAAALTRT